MYSYILFYIQNYIIVSIGAKFEIQRKKTINEKEWGSQVGRLKEFMLILTPNRADLPTSFSIKL